MSVNTGVRIDVALSHEEGVAITSKWLPELHSTQTPTFAGTTFALVL